jgi:hypothetical protein
MTVPAAAAASDSIALSGPTPRLLAMERAPSRIELLELDIDTRLSDLWKETLEIEEWNLEVVAAFMRAAYGKGYCDALTEDNPGRLCADHGYRVPDRRAA